MRVVLDTNVLVSGLLTPLGRCGDIVRLLTTDAIILCVDSRILLEYQEVIRRPRFNIVPHKADIIIDYIQASAEIYAGIPLKKALPDPDDNPFLEVALSSSAECLVTGNVKHFPVRYRAGIRVLSPAEFLDFFTKH
jgi:putative PIN family toxin of toxin-antitoxin system